VNIGDQPWPDPVGAARRVRDMQVKLHHWAVSDADRRFDDVFNLVAHPDFLVVAWARVRGNKGARTAGVDRVSPGWTGSARAPSPKMIGSRSFWGRCGSCCVPAPLLRCRYGNG